MFPLYDDNPTVRFPFVTILLIVLNTLVFAFTASLPPAKQQALLDQNGFRPVVATAALSPAGVVLRTEKGPVRLEAAWSDVLPTLFTCMFLHAGLMHLAGNMWFLWLFGNNVEDRLGPARFLIFYLATGLAASGVHFAIAPLSVIPTVGASGAISGVLGAYAVLYPLARVHTLVILVVVVTFIDLPALVVLGGWFLVQFWSASRSGGGVETAGVAFGAHVGGFVAGLVLILPFLLGTKTPAPRSGPRFARRRYDAD